MVNDAATLPGSLRGTTERGEPFELRLSAPIDQPARFGGADGTRLHGVLLGPGDHRTRTEDRPPPPRVDAGDRVRLGELAATVIASAGRRVELIVHARVEAVWMHIYAAGVPIQYAHRRDPLPLYAVQTGYAARPWAVEMASAGRPLTWDVLLGLRRASVEARRSRTRPACRRPATSRSIAAAVAGALRAAATHARCDRASARAAAA